MMEKWGTISVIRPISRFVEYLPTEQVRIIVSALLEFASAACVSRPLFAVTVVAGGNGAGTTGNGGPGVCERSNLKVFESDT
jgi:hypothetical protein